MEARCIADRIHGEVRLPRLVSQLSSTPEFYRLDDVRQLGGCFFIYPSATHTRREHSIGVCHLGGSVATQLMRHYPALVDDDDVLCVQIAGLVHDLGHGPFSHLFEEYVGNGWCHETTGVAMFRRMLRNHPNIVVGDHFRGAPDAQIAFVELLVTGLDPEDPWPENVGRPESKRFLCDLIHSRATGIDADKLDYLMRDALAVFGASNVLSVQRIIGAVRVHEGRIAFGANAAQEIHEMFRLRAKLHQQVYQHRGVHVSNGMIMALMRAIDSTRPSGTKLADLAVDERFAQLSDASILHHPLDDPGVREAHEALFRRPCCTRIPCSVALHTRPLCAGCRQPTDISDRYCGACGRATVDRPALADIDGALVTPECALTATSVEQELHTRMPGVEFRVHIVDVGCGTPIRIEDPFGRTWRDLDPFHNIDFLSDAGGCIKIDADSFFAPKMRRVRTVYCHLPLHTSAEIVGEAARVFRVWGATVGRVVEIEASAQ